VVALRDTNPVDDALQELAGALESLDLGSDLDHFDAERNRLVSTIRSYLIPRALDPSMPATVVFAGPTGSGKSTLVNSLSGRDVASTGAIRPTTTHPLVLASDHVAPDYEEIGGVPCRVVSGEAPVLGSMVLVDTPDIDSAVVEHRAVAERLVDHADVVVFVTSALRYADDVPWQVLRRAEARGTDVVNVLNRVGSATSGAIVDFRSRLRAEGLDDDVVTVPEHHLPDRGFRVPSTAIRSLARRLAGIAADREQRGANTFDRVLRVVVDQTKSLMRQIDDWVDETDSLEAELAIYLTDRASRLDLKGIADGLYEPPPAEGGRRAIRKWRSANRSSREEVAAREKTIVDRLVAAVQADLSRWIAAERTLDVTPGDMLARLGPVIRATAEGWVRYVARIAEEIDAPEPWLTEAALIHSATAAEETRAVDALLGELSSVLVERARRELLGRLDLIYEHGGNHVVESARASRGSLDVSGLRAALGAVGSTLAPVDA
jgi:energy-coupling factor transporter ATP-binding protein EcfA2